MSLCLPRSSLGLNAAKAAIAILRALTAAMKTITIWPFDEAAAFKYGELFCQLRKAGRPMQTIDIMVASIAFCLGDCCVITTDSDLLEFEKLSVQIW
ncbi:MAG: type II toxin-antitoxin system VapC family toxin [Planctomycetota bacterium]